MLDSVTRGQRLHRRHLGLLKVFIKSGNIKFYNTLEVHHEKNEKKQKAFKEIRFAKRLAPLFLKRSFSKKPA